MGAFAKVVAGKDVLEKMFAMPATGKNFLLKEYIVIKQARIIFPDEEPNAYDYKDYYDGFAEDDQYDLDSSDDGESHTRHLADRMRRDQMKQKAQENLKMEQQKAKENHEQMQSEVTYRQARETTHHLDEMM